MSEIIQRLAVLAIPLLLAITIPEAVHGFVAERLGDPTARQAGRLTLNPFRHIDPLGTIILPLLLLAASVPFVLGYPKPVPIVFENLRNPKRDKVLIAVSGPVANLVQAIVWLAVEVVLSRVGLQEEFFYKICDAGVLLNCVIFAFSLIPIPPLAGGRIVAGMLPDRLSASYSRLEPYGFFIVMALVITGVLGAWVQPIVSILIGLFTLVARSFL
jgi:Zn-dependent protease